MIKIVNFRCIAASLLWLVSLMAVAEKDLRFYMSNGEAKSVALTRVDSVCFDSQNEWIHLLLTDGNRVTISIAEVDSIKHNELPDGVYICYSGGKATVLNPYAFDGVNVEVSAAKVCVVSNSTTEIPYHLSGSSDNGCFKLYGSKKYELHLDGVSLTHADGAAINVQNKKRGQIYLTKGTNNYLSDGVNYTTEANEDEKGTLFSEGQLVILGEGELSVDAKYKHAMCSDDYIALNSGSVHVLSAVGDGLHANDSVVIRGGLLSITAQGDGIDSEGDLKIYDGKVTVQSDEVDVKGLKSDGNIYIGGGEISITMKGNRAKAIKSAGDAWMNGGALTINTHGAADYDEEGDISYATAIKTDRSFEQSNGILHITANGVGGQGISTDSMLTVKGGVLDITLNGAGSSYTTTAGATDYYSVKALKSDGEMNLLSGTITCMAKGNGGKCIVSDGILTIGSTNESELLTINASTSGSSLSALSSGQTGGGMWPGWRPGRPGGMGGQSGFNAAPKAIKGNSNVVINSGNITVQTQADGGEGIESKSHLTINGGTIKCLTYDDGINASTNLTVNGGMIYCYATNNDGVDSNGTFTFNGGITLSSGTTAPEEGFDCDNNSFVIKGGVLIGTGGATSSPTSASQCFSKITSVSVQKDKYLSVKDASGNVLFSYRTPNAVNSATVLLSAPQLSKTAHTLTYGVQSVTAPTETYFDGVFLMGGTISGGTSKSFTPTTK